MLLFFISFIVRPQQPIIELISKPNRDGFFSESTEFHARCSVRDGRPAANISWYIDNMPANKRTSPLQVVATPTHDNVELSTSVQEIQWPLTADDSNRKLVCRSHHQTDRESVPPQEAAYIINVRCKYLEWNVCLYRYISNYKSICISMKMKVRLAQTRPRVMHLKPFINSNYKLIKINIPLRPQMRLFISPRHRCTVSIWSTPPL